MMKFRNPYAQTPVEQKAAQHQAAVVTWLQAQPGNLVISLNELRAGLPAIAGDLSRPVVNQICLAIGAPIEDPSDNQA